MRAQRMCCDSCMACSDCLRTQVLTEFGLSGGQSQLICAPIDTAHSGARPTAQRGSADLVISNGVLNLCAEKQGAVETAAFWCKPGAPFVYSDVVREPPPPPAAADNATSAAAGTDSLSVISVPHTFPRYCIFLQWDNFLN